MNHVGRYKKLSKLRFVLRELLRNLSRESWLQAFQDFPVQAKIAT
jgi:hypothetical protein